MKTKLLFSLLLTSTVSFAQNSEVYIDFNNAKGLIGNSGSFFNNAKSNIAAYEIPKATLPNQVKHFSIYDMSLVMEGRDSLNNLCGFSKVYNNGDLFSGPIDDYLSMYYGSDAIWKINKSEILTHISDFSKTGYTMPEAILKWPANGNIYLGKGLKLAPFVDVNHNTVYEPDLGDYPLIKGDQAVYVIMNDYNGVRTNSQGLPQNDYGKQIGMEIHVMAYQFGTNDAINNTTFFNVKAFNRGKGDLHDVVFGLYTDFDLGNPSDDFIGSDSLRNMVFVYNGDDVDETNLQQGYGNEPPAVGVKFLSENANGAISYNGFSSVYPYNDPKNSVELNDFLHGKWSDGSDLLYGGNGKGTGLGATSNPAKFMFSGQTNKGNWTETTAGNSFGDRRALIYDSPKEFNKGQQICFDFAVIYSDAHVFPVQQIDSLAKVADFVQAFYDKQQGFCTESKITFLAGLNGLDLNIDYSVYPNPTNDDITVELSENRKLDNAIITVENSVGQTVKTQKVDGGLTPKIDLSDVSKGIYILKINGANAKKIVKN